MQNLVKILISFSMIISLFSCTKKINVDEKVLQIGIVADLKGMDPIYGTSTYDSAEISRIYEGLLQFHYLKRPYVLIPNLAQEMPTVSKDGLTYTFKIKKGVLFHDDKAFKDGVGKELVASDFVFSIKRLADPKLQSNGWWLLKNKIKGLDEWRKANTGKKEVNYDEAVEGIVALDKYTVQFKLKKMFPQFLYALAMPYTFAQSREVVNFYKDEFLNHPVGTGPFLLKSFTKTKKLTYYKNPKFRDKFYPTEASEEFVKAGLLKDAGKKVPFVDKIIVNIIQESQPRWLNFIKGKIDYLGIPKENFASSVTPTKEVSDELKKKGIRLSIAPSLDITYTAVNHDLKLFHNLKLRQAMSLAYNGDRSNSLFYNDRGIVAQSIVPPGIGGYLEGYNNPFRVVGNIKLAKKLLAEAGYPEGKGLPVITYDSTSSTASRQIAEFFAQQMKQIGIQIKVETSPWTDLQRKIMNRKVMLYGQAWLGDYPDAENFFQILYSKNRSPGVNGSGYNNPEFDALFEKASVMQDSPERTKLYEKINKMVAEDLPLLWGVHRKHYDLVHSWLKNYVTTDFRGGTSIYLNVDMHEKVKGIKKL